MMNTRSKTDKTAQGKPELPNYGPCESCGAEIGMSEDYPWHYADEDCRAIRNPQEPQAQHSPLPWHVELTRHISYRREEANGNVEIGGVASCERRGEYGAADAKLIVASVNNAEALAEALRDIMNEFAESDNDAPHLNVWKQAKQALARWEGAKS